MWDQIGTGWIVAGEIADLLSAPMTAAGNGIWGGGALLFAGLCHLTLRSKAFRDWAGVGDLFPETHAVLTWARLPAVCTAAHRTYWNLAIFFRFDGPYSPLMVEAKHITLIFVLGMTYGLYKAFMAVVAGRIRARLTAAFVSGVLAAAAVSFILASMHYG